MAQYARCIAWTSSFVGGSRGSLFGRLSPSPPWRAQTLDAGVFAHHHRLMCFISRPRRRGDSRGLSKPPGERGPHLETERTDGVAILPLLDSFLALAQHPLALRLAAGDAEEEEAQDEDGWHGSHGPRGRG